MSAASDRNLLFGVLALQIDAITADQLIQGMHGWVADKSRTLGELLLEQGALGRDQFTALEALVGARIRMFDNDPTESLAYLSSAGAVARLLCRVQDRELDASLQVMGAEREPNRDNGTIDERSHGYQRSTGSSTDGRFRIQRLHDEGGLGRVFVAEDTELGRQVALKELKETIAHDSASRTRFLTEAEITGGLEHPGIVPVYGLGHYDDGRPFYAMRFIQGDNLQVKIREYHETDWSKHGGVSAKSIELRRLLGRFIDVCEAIHYAHKRGVLHRDLKPGNIMAGRYGETLVVDWGLAKWLGQREFASDESSLDEEATLLPPSGSHASATRLGSAVGTPAFMSPEQARGEHDRLGPATDIYGLGATLYMLLTNHRPYEGEVDVLAAACRGALVRPRSVNPSIPKPLESICLRAMAFQPHERYPSAQELAADVEQFLGDEPVTAYREGLSEQARRWLRKHSTLAATLLGIGLMAVVLLLVVGRLYQQLHHQERRTDEERQRKESVIELMVSAFQRTDPNQDGRTVTVAQVLDDTVNEMGNSDTDDGTKTELLYAIGRSYHNLGLYDQAINVLSESQRRASKLLGEDHLYTLPVASAIGEAYRQTGQYAKSIEMHKECLAQFRRQFGEKDRDTLKSLNNLAAAYESAKKFDMAIPLFEQLLEQRREVLGSSDKDTLQSAINLAKTYSDAGRETDAANMYLDSELEERIKRCFGEDHTVTNTYDNNRAVFFYSTHRLDQALTSFRSLLEFRRRVLGPEHPATLESMHNLGRCLESLGQLEEAESQYRAILELVDDTSRTVQLREWKALQSVQLQQRKFGDTLKTIAQWRDAMSDHPERSQNVPMAQISQAEALLGVGRVAEALAILRTTVPQLVESRPTWLETQRGQVLLGGALALTDDRDQSAELMLKAFQSLRIQLPEIDPHYRWYVARAAERLVELYRARKNAAQTSIWEPELARVNAEIIRLRNETPE